MCEEGQLALDWVLSGNKSNHSYIEDKENEMSKAINSKETADTHISQERGQLW